MEFIDLKTQYTEYKEAIDTGIQNVLNHGQFIMGPEVFELEEKLAAFVGVKHCISVASGTASLEIALRALDIGNGDEVITVPFTWISTAEVIMAVVMIGLVVAIGIWCGSRGGKGRTRSRGVGSNCCNRCC